VLVLQDGGVLTGEITSSGDRYLIKQPQGEINIAASRVVTIGDSLIAAYEMQRQKRPHTVEAHLGLADWCLRHQLLPQAARELMDARGLDANHPRLALLERRLAAADRSTPPPATLSGTTSHATINDDDQKPALAPALLPPDLPSGVVEHFTRRVQPILVNNCTTSGCHQPGGKQAFQLDRASLHGLANRRTTMNNLAATLALVDREQPHLSPLLDIPRQPHGGMPDPLFTPRQRVAFSHLVDWVRLVTQTPPAISAATAQAELSESRASDEAADANASVQFDAQQTHWQPKDDFDAEIFNGALHPQQIFEQAADDQSQEAGSE
jgi:hypothetical protein